MGEFDLIRLIQAASPVDGEGVSIGPGDDAAILTLAPGDELVATCDTLNEGVHFLSATEPEALGHKSLAVNLSDLAAMGAQPRWALCSLSLPAADKDWLQAFMRGFGGLAAHYGVHLVGGDITRGPLSMTITALGTLPRGVRLLRSGASPGDLVVVSGTIGEAALALDTLQRGQRPPEGLLQRLERPQPRVALGRRLAGVGSACIDLSDGLAADLGHVAQASKCGFDIDLARLPVAGGLESLEDRRRWDLQLAGGDDYELCFTLPPGRQASLDEWSRELALDLTVIGVAIPGAAPVFRRPDGTEHDPGCYGYEHFAKLD